MRCRLCNEKATRIANLDKNPVNWDGAKPDYARTGIIVMCAAHTRANTFNQTLVWEKLDQVEEVAYKFGKLIGYHDGHYWRGGNALDAALGAAYGCNGESGPARRGIARVRGYDIYRTSEGQLVAVSCLDAYHVEEVA